MTKSRFLTFFLLIFIGFSCKKNYVPKPQSYFRIDERQETFVTYSNARFSFDIPSSAQIVSETKENEIWLTIRFPHYRAVLYCTFLPISKSSLRAAIDDNYRLAFSHTVKANGISQQVLKMPQQASGGILYKIGGNVATPRQFFVTDSLSNFFRASLYFDSKINADSLQPVINYMDKNITRLVSSLRWKN